MATKMECVVPGIPRPQGSKTRLANGGMIESSPHVASWRGRIEDEVIRARPDQPPVVMPVSMRLTFVFPRPKFHFTSQGVIKSQFGMAGVYARRPDLDKLIRAVLDACSHRLYVDDAQVDTIIAVKRYAGVDEQPHLRIEAEF